MSKIVNLETTKILIHSEMTQNNNTNLAAPCEKITGGKYFLALFDIFQISISRDT